LRVSLRRGYLAIVFLNPIDKITTALPTHKSKSNGINETKEQAAEVSSRMKMSKFFFSSLHYALNKILYFFLK